MRVPGRLTGADTSQETVVQPSVSSEQIIPNCEKTIVTEGTQKYQEGVRQVLSGTDCAFDVAGETNAGTYERVYLDFSHVEMTLMEDGTVTLVPADEGEQTGFIDMQTHNESIRNTKKPVFVLDVELLLPEEACEDLGVKFFFRTVDGKVALGAHAFKCGARLKTKDGQVHELSENEQILLKPSGEIVENFMANGEELADAGSSQEASDTTSYGDTVSALTHAPTKDGGCNTVRHPNGAIDILSATGFVLSCGAVLLKKKLTK